MALQSQFGTNVVTGAQVTYVGPDVHYRTDGIGGFKDMVLKHGMHGIVQKLDTTVDPHPQAAVHFVAGHGMESDATKTHWDPSDASKTVLLKPQTLHHLVTPGKEPEMYKHAHVSTVTLNGTELRPGHEVKYVFAGDRMHQAYAGMVGQVVEMSPSGHAHVNFHEVSGGTAEKNGVFVVPRRLVHHDYRTGGYLPGRS